MSEASVDFDPTRVDGVVFDLDGTLVDSYDAIHASLNHAREGWGLPALDHDAVRTTVGRGLECLIHDLVGPDRIEEGVRRFREHYARVFASCTRGLPGVAQTLDQLSTSGIRMSVASNKPARFSAPILDSLGWLGYFDTVEGPDTAGATKPEPSMLARCLEAMDVSSDRAIYVGDMVLDVESGRRAGVASVLVPGGSSSRDELFSTGRPVLESIRDLCQIPGRRDRA